MLRVATLLGIEIDELFSSVTIFSFFLMNIQIEYPECPSNPGSGLEIEPFVLDLLRHWG